ncbi:MAG: patatin-like phospholipase family protein [Bacteroidaceae bacterium]|nr:patatin-like phospholipase family protein [Bacteroidaceae bacterium]
MNRKDKYSEVVGKRVQVLSVLLFYLFTFLPFHSVSAQQDSLYANRKKVGVVLSGGGAKGMAHIGVLKVLERAGIPVDIITGTSMGSIIGGLYAIGYNANVLDSTVRVLDWSYVITDKEDLRNQSLSDRRKQYTYALTTGMSFGKHRSSEGGIIKGKNLAELFGQLCTGYTDSLDFSKDLPIPFACVATNIIDNSEVDFHSGRLPQAMRSSMAIPAAFAPVRLGDMVLVDGGLKNNYPADIAREMGADVIIGVTVQGAPKTADDIKGTMGVLSQIVDVNCKNKYDENLAITDVPIRVNTTGYGTASFTLAAIDTLVRRGEEEAMRHWDELIALKQKIGIDDAFRPTILQPLRPQVLSDRQHVSAFTFENMSQQDEAFLRQKFHLQKTDSIDANLQQQLTTSMRVDLFYKTAECRLVPEGDGVRVVLAVGERKSAQVYAGFRFDTEEYAAVQLGVDIPLKTTIPVSTEIVARLGKRIMARVDLTAHPRNFTRPSISYAYRRNDIDFYARGGRDYSVLYHQFQLEATPFNFDFRHFNIQLGLRWDYMRYQNRLVSFQSTGIFLPRAEHFYSYRGRVNYNSEDNWYFPTRGARFEAGYAYVTDNFIKLSGKSGMSDVSANWRKSFTAGSRLTFQPMVYGRLLFGDTVPLVFCNAVGGDWFGHYIEQQMPFAGFGNIEYVNRYFVAAQFQTQLRIASKHYVLLRLAGAQQSGKLSRLFKEKTLLGIQGAYYYNTIFGPIGATFGYSNRTKKPYFCLNLGYEF